MKRTAFGIEFNFSDLYLMCIFEQLANIKDRDFWRFFITDNRQTNRNAYVYISNELRWCISLEEYKHRYSHETDIKILKINILNFLWEVL